MAAATGGVNRSIAPAWTAGIRVGSLISVISFSEIRYEGFLMELNPHPFTIGLRNVRLLGTEGRKKHGRQIPPNDKIYEYMYLRGSNIKDLRVISPPSAQNKLPVSEDTAIIRPRVAQPTPTTIALTSHGAAELANVSASASASAQPILPGTSFQFSQSRDPSASSSSVRRPLLPPPPANNSRLAVPNYLPGLAGSSGIMSHFQQKLPPPPPSLLASKAPVQQQAQRQNANTSVVGGSSFVARHPPLLLGRSTTSSNAVPPLVSTPSVQRNPKQSSPSQSFQIIDTRAKAALSPVMALDTKARTALAPVMESLPSDRIEETLESSLKLSTETGSTPSHHEKGQSSQGKEQVHGGPHEDTGHSLGRKDEKPSVKRGFKEDFNFEAMNKKFNKKKVWEYFSKSKGEARRLGDNSKPVYSKEEFFDSLSYGATDNESAKVRISEQKDEETFGAEIPIIQEHRGPRKQEWRPRVK